MQAKNSRKSKTTYESAKGATLRYLGWVQDVKRVTSLSLDLCLRMNLVEEFVVEYLLEARKLNPKTIASYLSAIINVVRVRCFRSTETDSS